MVHFAILASRRPQRRLSVLSGYKLLTAEAAKKCCRERREKLRPHQFQDRR